MPAERTRRTSPAFDPTNRVNRGQRRASPCMDASPSLLLPEAEDIPETRCSPVRRPPLLADPRGPRVRLRDLECLRAIGEGAFGQVMLARNRTMNTDEPWYQPGRLLAIKSCNKLGLRRLEAEEEMHPSEKYYERQQLQSLPWNPFVCGLLGVFHDKRNLYLAMELAPGECLGTLMHKRGPMSSTEASFYFSNIVCGLEFLHSYGIVHRDIKPNNILMATDGYLCLADFGSAKIETVVEPEWSIQGTALYTAPELLQSSPSAKQGWRATDWWSAGVTLFEMLTGELPFYGNGDLRTYQRLRTGKYRWPENVYVGEKEQHLVGQLLTLSWWQRLQAEPIKAHPWLRNVDWKKMNKKHYLAPFIPLERDLERVYHKNALPEQKTVPGLLVVHPPRERQHDGRFPKRPVPPPES